MGRPLGWNPKPTFAYLDARRAGRKTSQPRPPVHATTQRFITRVPPTQPRARRCARAGRGQRFARASLRHNVCRQTTSNLHLGFSVRLTFDMSGTWKPAQLAVRCPLDGGVGHQEQHFQLTFAHHNLNPARLERRANFASTRLTKTSPLKDCFPNPCTFEQPARAANA
jgi:hypothetical protein